MKLVFKITIKFAQAVGLMTCLPIVTSRSSSSSSSSTCYSATGVKLQLIKEVREKKHVSDPCHFNWYAPKIPVLSRRDKNQTSSD